MKIGVLGTGNIGGALAYGQKRGRRLAFKLLAE